MTRKNSKNQSLTSCRMKMSRRSQESMSISSRKMRNISVSEHSPRTTSEKHTRDKNESVPHVSRISNSMRWKQIISLLGLSEARRQPRTARCSVRIAIAQRVGNNRGLFAKISILSREILYITLGGLYAIAHSYHSIFHLYFSNDYTSYF